MSKWVIEKATGVFEDLWSAITAINNKTKERIFNVFGLEGGSRSSKTTSIIQALLVYALKSNKPLRISAFRKKKTWCRDSIWFDFKQYLKKEGLFDEDSCVDGRMEYYIFGSVFEFGGLDDEQRLVGRTQDIVWLNESIECDKESFDELEQRTSDFMLLDWNPKVTEHWVYNEVEHREDAWQHNSTILDNPFAPKNMRRKVMSYEPWQPGSYEVKDGLIYYQGKIVTEEHRPPIHPNNVKQKTANIHKWKIYGLGIRSQREGRIFENVIIEEFNQSLPYCYVMDFGFHPDPTTLTRMAVDSRTRRIYVDEKFYEDSLSTSQLIERVTAHVKNKRDLIVVDTNQGITRQDLLNSGFNVKKAQKGLVVDDIKAMEDWTFILTPDSVNAKMEFDNYVWSDKKAGIPIDDYNHIIDPVRYGFRALQRKRRRAPRRVG